MIPTDPRVFSGLLVAGVAEHADDVGVEVAVVDDLDLGVEVDGEVAVVVGLLRVRRDVVDRLGGLDVVEVLLHAALPHDAE